MSKSAVSQIIISKSGREESSGKNLGRSVLFLQSEMVVAPILDCTFAAPMPLVVTNCNQEYGSTAVLAATPQRYSSPCGAKSTNCGLLGYVVVHGIAMRTAPMHFVVVRN